MQLNAIFHRKEPQFAPRACVVEKIIELDSREYEDFRSGMLRDQQFIAASNPVMRVDVHDVAHCILALGEGCDDGVLINSEGADYARYTAFIPGARQLLAAEEMQAELVFKNQMARMDGVDVGSIQAWIKHARELAKDEYYTSSAEIHHDYLRSLREFGGAFQRIAKQFPGPAAELFNRQAFCLPDQLLPAAARIDGGYDIDKACEHLRKGGFNPLQYASNKLIEDGRQFETAHHSFAGVQDAYGLSDCQLTLLWDHLRAREEIGDLLIHEDRGIFTLCFKPGFQQQDAPEPLTQEDLEVMHARHMLWCYDQSDGVRADFSGQFLSGLEFEGKSFCDADFTGATIHQCRMGLATFDGSDFSGAKLRGVAAYQGDFTNANFTGATLEYCNFTEASLDGADFSQADLVECEGLDDINQGPAMTMGGGM